MLGRRTEQMIGKLYFSAILCYYLNNVWEYGNLSISNSPSTMYVCMTIQMRRFFWWAVSYLPAKLLLGCYYPRSCYCYLNFWHYCRFRRLHQFRYTIFVNFIWLFDAFDYDVRVYWLETCFGRFIVLCMVNVILLYSLSISLSFQHPKYCCSIIFMDRIWFNLLFFKQNYFAFNNFAVTLNKRKVNSHFVVFEVTSKVFQLSSVIKFC